MAMVKRTNDEWRELLAAQRTSGQSQKEWCAANSVNLHTFRDRRGRLKRKDCEKDVSAGQSAKDTTEWMRITPERLESESCAINIERNGFVVRVTEGSDIDLLCEVLRVVNRV